MQQAQKNFEIEISGLDIALTAHKAKLKAKDDQLQKANGFVKKYQDEVRRIIKEVNPKMIKSLKGVFEKDKKEHDQPHKEN